MRISLYGQVLALRFKTINIPAFTEFNRLTMRLYQTNGMDRRDCIKLAELTGPFCLNKETRL